MAKFFHALSAIFNIFATPKYFSLPLPPQKKIDANAPHFFLPNTGNVIALTTLWPVEKIYIFCIFIGHQLFCKLVLLIGYKFFCFVILFFPDWSCSKRYYRHRPLKTRPSNEWTRGWQSRWTCGQEGPYCTWRYDLQRLLLWLICTFWYTRGK